jgi:glycerol-3-phosphate dehydrogenase
MPEPVYDLAIIGGGVNGCGVARDASGRGLSIYLCEQGDLASGASSAATKLIHGGLRYLEYGEFRLVREALSERETLWRVAPHVVRPLRFVLPHHQGLRPAWLLRLGLFLYDHLGERKLLPPTATLDLTRDPAGAPLKRGAFSVGLNIRTAGSTTPASSFSMRSTPISPGRESRRGQKRSPPSAPTGAGA